MKIALFTIALAVLAALTGCERERSKSARESSNEIPPGFDMASLRGAAGTWETVNAKIEEVFTATGESGSIYRAYRVKWKGHDVVVGDMFGTTEFGVGDDVDFMVTEVDLGDEGSAPLLQFYLLEFP